MDKPQTILIVDPETDFLEWAQHQLADADHPGHHGDRMPRTASSSSAASTRICCIVETHLSPFSGTELLVKARQRDPNAIVIMMSAFGTTQLVIESMKLGAFDFIRKETLPFNLKVVVDAALKAQAEMRAATTFKPQLTVEEYQDSHRRQIAGHAAGLQDGRPRLALATRRS